MFPFTYKYFIGFHIDNTMIPNVPEYAANIIATKLKTLKPKNLSVNSNRIIFNGGLFRHVGRFNLLGPIDYGEINIAFSDNKVIVSYKLRFLQLLFASLLIPILFGFFITSGDLLAFELSLMGMAVIFCFGLNFIISILRFHSFLKRAIYELLKSVNGTSLSY